MEKLKTGVFIPAGRKVWEHERWAADILALAGHYVEFLLEGRMPSADLLLDGIEYELKSPEHFNANTLEHTIKDALKQSPNLIISMSRLKKVRSDKMRNFLINQVRKSKQVKRIFLITRQGQIIDIKALIW